jgi:hypothetical protein
MLHDIKGWHGSKIKMVKIIYTLCHYEKTKKTMTYTDGKPGSGLRLMHTIIIYFFTSG